jgi:hypothetical protein
LTERYPLPLPRAARHALLAAAQVILLALVECAVSWATTKLFHPEMDWARDIPEGVFIITALELVFLGPPLCLAFIFVGYFFNYRLPIRLIFLVMACDLPFLALCGYVFDHASETETELYNFAVIVVLPTALVAAWAWQSKKRLQSRMRVSSATDPEQENSKL